MITTIALSMILSPAYENFKIPVYNADQKNPAVMTRVSTKLPAGFTAKDFGSGEINSEDGKITVTLLHSSAAMPNLLRNPKYMHLKDFTTIRMTNWIGFRNSNPNGEDYKLDFNRYRINFSLIAKDHEKVLALRNALHTIIDNLDFVKH